MKKGLGIVVSLAMVLALCPALLGFGLVLLDYEPVGADTSCNIDIVATGSEVDISCNVTQWNVGFVSASTHYTTNSTHSTANTWGAITNDGSEAVDLTIYGNDMQDVGVTVTWSLVTTPPSGAQIRMMIGLPTNDNFTVVKEGGAYLTWKDELAAAASQSFGLDLDSPTAGNVGNEVMVMTNGGAGSSGLVITGSID